MASKLLALLLGSLLGYAIPTPSEAVGWLRSAHPAHQPILDTGRGQEGVERGIGSAAHGSERWVCVGEVTCTAYCPCAKCCGKWSGVHPRRFADGTPVSASHGRATLSHTHELSSSMPMRPSRIIAAPRSIPFGTRLWIEGIGLCIVRDRLAKRYDARIDIFMPTHQSALDWGIQRRKVWRVR